MKVGEKPWWPPSWRYQNTDPVPEGLVTGNCILINCSIVDGDLIMIIDCDGRFVRGRMGRSVNAPTVEQLLYFFQLHEGDSIESIENLEFDLP
jgi:hypothetical protein